MAAELFFDLGPLEAASPIAGPAEIEAVNPQRGAMRHLDAVVWHNEALSEVVGYKQVRGDEFWVPGHIPGRPLLPGVIMIEAAAQVVAYLMKMRAPQVQFVGFVGCDGVKFRGQVKPGDRLYVLAREVQFRPRRVICDVQGVVDRSLVFEGTIYGMPI